MTTDREREIYLQVGAELLMLIFAFLRQAGISDEEAKEKLSATRNEFYAVVDEPLPEVPE